MCVCEGGGGGGGERGMVVYVYVCECTTCVCVRVRRGGGEEGTPTKSRKCYSPKATLTLGKFLTAISKMSHWFHRG